MFFDTEPNRDIRADEPWAHLALLATHMNFMLWDKISKELRRPLSGDPVRDSAALAD